MRKDPFVAPAQQKDHIEPQQLSPREILLGESFKYNISDHHLSQKKFALSQQLEKMAAIELGQKLIAIIFSKEPSRKTVILFAGNRGPLPFLLLSFCCKWLDISTNNIRPLDTQYNLGKMDLILREHFFQKSIQEKLFGIFQSNSSVGANCF